MTDTVHGPREINWDLTYACPLRCVHCYSESGRRPSRQLSTDDMLRVADALVSLRPRSVQISGGEPLLVRDLPAVIDRFRAAGIEVDLYTSGWLLDEAALRTATERFNRIHVSVDGATGAVHDRIRARRGSFDRAMHTLSRLETAASGAPNDAPPGWSFGVDCVVMASNAHQLEDMCTTLAERFPHMSFLSFGAVVPAGLASRPGFAEKELLDDEQLARLRDREYLRRLQALVPPSVVVQTFDGWALQMSPQLVERGEAITDMMQVEPDGRVRSMPIYEGTVGSLLEEPAGTLWERAVRQRSHPVVTSVLGSAATMTEWAAATRKIDLHFAAETELARLHARPDH